MPTKVSEKKSKATAVADPSEAAKTRILEILKDRGGQTCSRSQARQT